MTPADRCFQCGRPLADPLGCEGCGWLKSYPDASLADTDTNTPTLCDDRGPRPPFPWGAVGLAGVAAAVLAGRWLLFAR